MKFDTVRFALCWSVLAVGSLCLPPVFGADLEEFDSFEREIRFSNPNGEKVFEIDNVFGSIQVQGYAGDSVQMTVDQTLVAENRRTMQEAIEFTSLELSERDNHILAYADAPYRHEDRHRGYSNNRHYGYHAKYDLVVRVPFETDLILKTVTGGDIRVTDIVGNFEIRNVNGSIHMDQIDGPCSARTVNGPVTVNFRSVPGGDCDFKTVNGDLTLTFPSEPHGDYRLKTFNGQMYSDYSFSTLPSNPAVRTKKGGLTKIKTDGFVGVRIGTGGPEFKLDTLNGDITIRNN